MILIYILPRIRYNRRMSDMRRLQFDRLPPTERLVLVTLRARVDGCRGSAVETLYRIACGLAWVERAMASFDAMTETLTAGARRPIGIAALADAGVACDERCLLALLAAHQQERPAQVEARARWLVRGAFRAPLERASGAFAAALERSGRRLSIGWLEPPRRLPRTPPPMHLPPAQQSSS